MMMTTKPFILVACTLVFFAFAVLAAPSSSGPTECCFEFATRRLPKDRVVSYKYTDPRCAKSAVVFTMKKGGIFCVDPSVQWVKNIIVDKVWNHTKAGK